MKRAMKKNHLSSCLVAIAALTFSCAATQQIEKNDVGSQTLAQLRQRIDQALMDSSLSQSSAGLKIVSLETGEVLYQKNPTLLFHPASNMKLLTTAAALNRLGPSFRFETTLTADSVATGDSSVVGNLYFKGSADPELDDESLRQMVVRMRAAGISHVTGDLVCDASYLDTLRLGVGWMWDDTNGNDWAPISALSTNHNTISITVSPADTLGEKLDVRLQPPTDFMKIDNAATTVDSSDTVAIGNFSIERDWQLPRDIVRVRGGLAIHSAQRSKVTDVVDPTLYAGTRLVEIMRRQGVDFRGRIVKARQPDSAVVIASHISRPLGELMMEINKPSDNLYAELLLKTVAAEVKGPPGTAAGGLAIVKEVLSQAGVDSNEVYLVDGSGVSRYNLISPAHIVKLLIAMHNDFRIQAEFKASLPIAGRDGTLKNRMQNTPAAGKLRAKTGSLRGVSALSGYTTTADGEPIVFSMMMQHFVGAATPVRTVQDQIGVLISSFSRRPSDKP